MLHSYGVSEVEVGASRRAQYSSDASNYRVVPLAVVFPRSVEEVIAVEQVSAITETPLTVRGGGTSVAGNAVGPGIVLDLSRYLNRVVDVNLSEMTATVEPGVVLDQLQKAVASSGLRFGPDPSTHSRCTVGGMIGNNACGSHSVAFGRTAENVISLDVIDGKGRRFLAEKGLGQVGGLSELVKRHSDTIRAELGRFGRQVSGYSLEHLLKENGEDLAKALVGTEGTCVVVLGAKLALVPVPVATALTVLGYPDMASAADAVTAILELHPQAIEGIDSRLVDVVRRHNLGSKIEDLPKGEGWLFVETAGDSDSEAFAAGEAIAAISGAIDATVVPAGPRSKALWRIREDGAGLAGRTPQGRQAWPGWEDAAVPPSRLGSYLREFQDLLQEYRLDGLMYGHFGDGCVHVRLDFPLDHSDYTIRPFLVDAAELVANFGGSLSGEHGDGRARSELLPIMYSKDAIAAFEEFKGLFDPKGLLNPGIVVNSISVDSNLRLPSIKVLPRSPGFILAEDDGDFGSAVHRCVGVGKCRADNSASGGSMCPSFLATSDEKESTRARARVLQEMMNGSLVKGGWRSPEVHEVLDLCLSCKACATDCPAGVDMAKYKAEVLHQAYRRRIRPISHYSLGWLPRWAKVAAVAPSLVNLTLANRTISRAICYLAGVDSRRTLPRFAPKTFTEKHPSSAVSSLVAHCPGEIFLFVDSFTNYFSPEVAEAAVQVLSAAGFAVKIAPSDLCCAITWISTGQLDVARNKLRHLVNVLAPAASQGTPIVVLEPSCAAVLRGDLLDLVAGESAARVSEAVHTFAEIINRARKREESPWIPPDLSGTKVIVQPHCHQYSVIGFEEDRTLLQAAGAEVQILVGCCGLAGNFGMERGHYDLSVKVAQRTLLPALDLSDQNTVVLADGFSCRTQVADLSPKRAIHLAQLIADRLTPPVI
ncbi:MAG: FAD-binding oxidoreductase [Acidimicrobiaceae bacterium]|nr:FAD-binding oxidoreductase [Acidimicrobiaceae bacterium]